MSCPSEQDDHPGLLVEDVVGEDREWHEDTHPSGSNSPQRSEANAATAAFDAPKPEQGLKQLGGWHSTSVDPLLDPRKMDVVLTTPT